MQFRTILGAALAGLFFSAASVAAGDRIAGSPRANASAVPVPHMDIVAAGRGEAGLLVAQAEGDPRVMNLEEELRKLNGTIEDLNFQVLQLQEQVRKMQEDDEFRFQELEKKSDGAKTNRAATEKPKTDADKKSDASQPGTIDDVIAGDQVGASADTQADPNRGAAPRNIGSMTVDSAGNVVGGNVTTPPDKKGSSDNTVVASLPATNDPEEVYRNAYQFILSGDYGTAEAGFRDHINRFPSDTRAPDAHFWLGEALLGQKKYRDAAEVFLAANKDYPKAKKAPDMLLKLGVSLVGLNQRDVACATFGEVNKRYPDASSALKERVKQEQAAASC